MCFGKKKNKLNWKLVNKFEREKQQTQSFTADLFAFGDVEIKIISRRAIAMTREFMLLEHVCIKAKKTRTEKPLFAFSDDMFLPSRIVEMMKITYED